MISRRTSPAGAVLTIALLLIMSASAVMAQETETPVDVARRHFLAMKSADLDTYVDLMHPAELTRFKNVLSPAIAADTSGEGAKQLFDLNSSAEFMRLTDREVFERFMQKFVFGSPDFRETMSGMSTEFVGSVPEGTDVAHVVYRLKMIIYGGIQSTSLEVVSLKRFGNGWRMMLDKEMEGMSQMLVDMVKEAQEAKANEETVPYEEYQYGSDSEE